MLPNHLPPPPWTPANQGRAHWKLYIPYHNSSIPFHEIIQPAPGLGKLLEVTGSPFLGYTLAIMRLYDPAIEGRKAIGLGNIVSSAIREPGVGDNVVEMGRSVDLVEQIAGATLAPGPSKRPLDGTAGETCQGRMRRYVAALVEAGVLDAKAMEVLDYTKREFNSKPR